MPTRWLRVIDQIQVHGHRRRREMFRRNTPPPARLEEFPDSTPRAWTLVTKTQKARAPSRTPKKAAMAKREAKASSFAATHWQSNVTFRSVVVNESFNGNPEGDSGSVRTIAVAFWRAAKLTARKSLPLCETAPFGGLKCHSRLVPER